MTRFLACLLAVAAVATAKPPKSENFLRMDDLTPRILKRIKDLEAQEAFERLSRWEKMIILFERGEKTFEGKKLTGDYLVKQVLKEWPAVQAEKPTEAVQKALKGFARALEERFAKGVDIDKRARRKAAKPLVDALTDDRFHIREAAIESLKKMYRNTGLMYQPDAHPNDRLKRQRDWEKHIKRK